MPPVRELEVVDDGWARIEAWRMDQLLRVGYPEHLASLLAERPDVDLHKALDLIVAGCSFKTAAKILL